MRINRPTLEKLVEELNKINTYSDLKVDNELKKSINTIAVYAREIESNNYYIGYKFNSSYIDRLNIEVDLLNKMIKAKSEAASSLSEELTVEKVKKDIEYLIKTFEKVNIKKRKNSSGIEINVLTKPIMIEHKGINVDFGQFKISVLFSNNGYAPDDVKIVSLKSKALIPHPHVNRKYLCFGDYKTAFNSCIQKKLISEAFDIVYGILKTYNAASPYMKIETFIEHTCPICKAIRKGYTGNTCTQCGDSVCGSCSYYDRNLGYGCKNCVGICKECGRKYIFSTKNTKEYCFSCVESKEIQTAVEQKTVEQPKEIAPREEYMVVGVGGLDLTTIHVYQPSTMTTTTTDHVYSGLDVANDPDEDETEDDLNTCALCQEAFEEELQEHSDGLVYCSACLFKKIVEEEGQY